MTELNIVQSGVPSHQHITQAGASFFIGSDEFQSILDLHRDLHVSLKRVRAYLVAGSRAYGDAATNEKIYRNLFQGVPFGYGRTGPSFVTTEMILDEQRKPYLVSVDAHSTRHWDAMIGLSRSIPSTVTSTNRLVDAIGERARGRRIVMIDGSNDQRRHAGLMRSMISAGLRVERRSLSRAVAGSSDGSVVFDLSNSIRNHAGLRAEASFIVEPLAYLSGQYLLALLGNAQGSVAVDDILRNGMGVEDRLRDYLPKTLPFDSTCIPERFVLKKAMPFTTQCVIESDSNSAFEPDDVVFQERIDPLKIRLPKTQMQCPIRLVFISYEREVVTGMAVARIPANGVPQKDVALDIVIR